MKTKKNKIFSVGDCQLAEFCWQLQEEGHREAGGYILHLIPFFTINKSTSEREEAFLLHDVIPAALHYTGRVITRRLVLRVFCLPPNDDIGHSTLFSIQREKRKRMCPRWMKLPTSSGGLTSLFQPPPTGSVVFLLISRPFSVYPRHTTPSQIFSF